MPAITSSSTKVLVSGANGFMAIWVCQKLLEKGYNVRGTMRSANKATHLRETFKAYGDRFEVVVVEDITADGAFDDAVKDIDAIAHTASPADFTLTKPDDFIEPAVKGTLGLMESAMKHGHQVKRVVITASASCIYEHARPDVVFTEDDWNEQSVLEIKEKGTSASVGTMYEASKTLAEKAAWKFVEDRKPTWDLTVLHPSWIFGPVLHEVSSANALNVSSKMWYDMIVKGFEAEIPATARTSPWVSYIDVRDLADAHVAAIEKESAGGERIIVSLQPPSLQDWWIAASKVSPTQLSAGSLHSGIPGRPFRYLTAKADEILGLTFLTIEETTRDIIADFEKRGW